VPVQTAMPGRCLVRMASFRACARAGTKHTTCQIIQPRGVVSTNGGKTPKVEIILMIKK